MIPNFTDFYLRRKPQDYLTSSRTLFTLMFILAFLIQCYPIAMAENSQLSLRLIV